jgi:hypothetical protein
MAAMFWGSNLPVAFTFFIAPLIFCHHVSGDCSAQPVCNEMIVVSSSGYCAEAMHCCVSASTIDTLIEEVPRSIPSSNILLCIKIKFTVEH